VSVNVNSHSRDPIGITTRTLNSGRRLVSVSGELDLASSGALSETLERELSAGNRVLLDLSGVTFIDSTGLAAIINAARAPGAQVELSAVMRSQTKRLLELSGVLPLLPFVDGQVA
jgi:anti-anti-sigma factor